MYAKAILNSWKEIAEYVGRSARTLQRWERDLGFPVHRPHGKLRSAVVAIPSEIDSWIQKTPTAAVRNSHVARMRVEPSHRLVQAQTHQDSAVRK